MNFQTLLIAAGAYLGYKFVTQKKDEITEMQASIIPTITDVSMDWNNILAPKLYVQVDINNPSQGAATLTDVFATIKHSQTGTIIGTINQHVTIPIEPMNTTPINFPVTFNALNIVLEIAAGNIEPEAKIEGYIKANGIKFDFVKEIGIPGF